MSSMITESFVGDRALVRLTGMPGFPFPSYQLPTFSIRQSEADPVTGARAPTPRGSGNGSAREGRKSWIRPCLSNSKTWSGSAFSIARMRVVTERCALSAFLFCLMAPLSLPTTSVTHRTNALRRSAMATQTPESGRC